MSGRTLGNYQVEALIGVGGMGEVYRARDIKLGRAVAIKVLPQGFTSDPARLARFDREARTLAALNHPNVCAIYGFEEAEAIRFLVLELVDGETLADRLAVLPARPEGRHLPQRDALNIARQIARAVAFAHEAGIVHRDLKPANIKITAGGTVKVLDFGLAKAAGGEGAGADLALLPQAPVEGTIDGAIIGTPAYMSPEQARGKPVDKRTDIWAFGCILFEMLAGRAAFAGDTVADTLARVIEREPDWPLLPDATPEQIRNLLLGCLAKDPQDRLRDIGDVRITLDSMLSGSSPGPVGIRAAGAPKQRATWLPWAVVAALVVGLGWSLWGRPGLPSVTPTRWPINLEAGQQLDGSGGGRIVALSRDGSQMAYVAYPQLLYVRPIGNEPAVRAIPGTELYKGMREVRYSPDGKDFVFYAFGDHTLKRMKIEGGPPTTICDADTPTGLEWADNNIVLFGQREKGIWQVSVNGGTPELVAAVNHDQRAHGPQLLPDRDHFLFTRATGSARESWDTAEIVVGSLRNHRIDKTGAMGSDARYVPKTGHLLFARGGSIYAMRFDPDSRTVTGTAEIVEEGVSRAAGSYSGTANFSVSDDGTLAFVPGPKDLQLRMEISLIDPVGRGTPKRLNAPAGGYVELRAAPNESMIAFGKETDDDKKATIYTLATDGKGIPLPLTPPSIHSRYPVWTPDSKRIAFQSNREGGLGIWWQAADGSDAPTRLLLPADGEVLAPESWSKDDVLLYSVTKDGSVSLRTMTVQQGRPGPSQPFGRTTSVEAMSAVFSPDGHLVAYTKTSDGEITVCVERFPSSASPACLPPQGADTPKHPRWSKGGDRLYFDPRFGNFESVPVNPRSLEFGPREAVDYHPFRLAPPGDRTPYDITASGKIVGLTTPGAESYKPPNSQQIVVVLNWFEHLKQKMGE